MKRIGIITKVLLIALAGFLVACNSGSVEESSKEAKSSPKEKQKPRNIIFLIGDGMGLSQASITFYYGEGSEFRRFLYTGFMGTSSATHKITDSAASGTALSTGEKTYNGAIGVDTDSARVKNLSEILAESHRIGVISTSSITHATPAAYYGHVKDRDNEEKIARQLLESPVDFFAGGGYGFFNHREDGRDLMANFPQKGFMVDTNSLDAFESFKAEKKYGYLLAKEAMPVASERGDFLASATSKALDYFDAAQKPFFLMVEGSQIDWACHDNDTQYMINETLDFQKAVKVARDYAEENPQTLVVVTTDHETGGFALSAQYGENKDYDKIKPSFATGGHSAALVPVFAHGPGAEDFVGIYENSDLFEKFKNLAQ